MRKIFTICNGFSELQARTSQVKAILRCTLKYLLMLIGHNYQYWWNHSVAAYR